MCGLVGAVSHRDVVPSLVEGLRRLEYRGYDSAGIAAIAEQGLVNTRAVGKVDALSDQLASRYFAGTTGIGHTRWATHGEPSVANAHPQISGGKVAVVHNGIIENHDELRGDLEAKGYSFSSDTDTEVIAHLVHAYLQKSDTLHKAVRLATKSLVGTFAIAVISSLEPHKIVAARRGSPLLIGVSNKGNYLASDVSALLPVTQYFIVLDDGDFAEVLSDSVNIVDQDGRVVIRELVKSEQHSVDTDKGSYQHFMQKEIFEQDEVLERTLLSAVNGNLVDGEAFGPGGEKALQAIQHVHIVACGTSYHAGLVASYTIESLCGISCKVELASEYRYRRTVVNPDTLFITLSQSGETADTLAALRYAKQLNYRATLTICNVAESSLVRESDLVFLTQAGPEIGVASTKAFTTQLMGLNLLAILIARHSGRGLNDCREASLVSMLKTTPELARRIFGMDGHIKTIAEGIANSPYCLFLGRGQMYPIAMEGALKLKEISYLYADAYAAGELKHGPLALVDETVPVIALTPSNPLLGKMKSNLAEVRARGGKLILIGDHDAGLPSLSDERAIEVPKSGGLITPMLYSLPLQLLAYHVAVFRGTNVDQPRNLAKSVTVE